MILERNALSGLLGLPSPERASKSSTTAPNLESWQTTSSLSSAFALLLIAFDRANNDTKSSCLAEGASSDMVLSSCPLELADGVCRR